MNRVIGPAVIRSNEFLSPHTPCAYADTPTFGVQARKHIEHRTMPELSILHIAARPQVPCSEQHKHIAIRNATAQQTHEPLSVTAKLCLCPLATNVQRQQDDNS